MHNLFYYGGEIRATSVGTIQLDLEVKSDIDDDVQKSSQKLAKQIRESMKAYSNDLFKELREGLSSSLDKVQETIENCLNKTKSEMKQFVDEMREITKNSKMEMPIINNDTPIKPMQSATQKVNPVRGPPTKSSNITKSQIDAIGGTIDAQKAKLKALQQQYLDIDAAIGKKNDMQESLDAQKELISDLKKEVKQLENSPIEVRLKNIDQLEKLRISLREAIQEAEQLEKALSSKKNMGLEGNLASINEKIVKLKNSINSNTIKKSSLESSLDGVSKGSRLGKLKSLSSSISNLGRNFKNVGSKIKSTVSHISNFTSKLNGANKNTNGYRQSLGSLIRTFTIFSLVFPLVSSGIRSLGKYLLSSLQTNSQFVSSLNQIKSNLQTAFTPIFNAILPAINSLMSTIAKATAYISAFISAIFGKSLSQSKKATAGINNARNALDGTGSSAKKASSAIKEATQSLMGFDAINKLDSDKDSGSDGGESGAYTPTDIDTSTVSGFAKKLRDMWKKGDYSGIGKAIGEQVNKAVLSFTDFISWDRVGGKITKFIDAFCEILNSLIDTINWENIGKMFGTGINTIANTIYRLINGINWDRIGKAFAQGLNGLVKSINWNNLGATVGSYFQSKINALYGFVTTADWAGIGKALADGIMGLVNSIDWGKAGETLSIGIRGLFSSLRNFIANINWKQLGKDVWNFLSSIDWSGIVHDVAYIIGQAIASIGSFLWGFIEDAVISIRDYWAKQFEDCGGHIILGLLKGIGEAVLGIGTWIKENIFDPFIDGFKSIFGIHSPSTVMAEMGKNLIQGLINGIKSIPILGTVIDVVGKGIDWIGEQCNNIKEKGTQLFENLKNGIAENPIVQTISKKVSEGIDWIGTQYSNIKSKGKDLFENVKKGITNNPIVQTVSGVIGNGINAIKNKYNEFKNKGKDTMSNLKSGISSNQKNPINQIASVASSMASKIASGAINKASSWGSDMMSGLAKGIRGATKWVTNAVSNVARTISSWLHFTRPDIGPLREYETWMPDFMKGMTDGIERNKSKLIDSIKTISNDMANSFNALQQPEIAFAGSQSLTVTHVIENSTKEDELKAILDELKNLKEYFVMVKDAINDKDQNVYLDIDRIYNQIVEKHNKNARRKGKSDFDI